MLQRLSFLICFVATFLVACSITSAQKPLAITNATIYTGTGEKIENGTIVLQDGKIRAVGKDVKVPVAARVLDGTGHVVMPGLVEAHTSSGLSQSNETNNNVPYVTVIDGIDPMNSYFQQARRNGITTVRISPGNSTMIGGQAAVIKTGGGFIDSMVIDGVAGIKISMRPVSGSRMAHLAAMRKAFSDAKEKLEEEEKKDKKDGEAKSDDKKSDDDKNKIASPEAKSELDKAMNALLTGKNSAIIYCDKAMDVGQALRLIKEFDLKASLVLGRDCYKAAKEIAASKLPVILDSTLVFWEEDPRTKEEEKIVLPKIYREAGVEFVFQTSSPGSATLGSDYLWYQAATGVKYGMSESEAIASITSLPAKFLNVDKFVGTLEEGKDADLVLLSGDPLKLNTWVEKTIVDGEIVYDKTDDEQLKRLLTGDESDSN